jgi:hypothetical protein
VLPPHAGSSPATIPHGGRIVTVSIAACDSAGGEFDSPRSPFVHTSHM